VARDRFVRQQHELLDQPHAVEPHRFLDVDREALFVQLDDRLGQVEIEASSHPAFLLQHLRQTPQGLELP
jgi:hypothetical protein